MSKEYKEFRVIRISAGTPFERGVQYGAQAKAEINRCIDTYHKHFQSARSLSWEQVCAMAEAYIPDIQIWTPDILEEVRGIAKGAGADFLDLMVLNCRYEILHFPRQNECTAYALQREATAERHVLVGQNWDNRPYLLDHTLLLHITEQESGNVIFGMTEAGQPIRNGFCTNGVAQCSNSLRSSIDRQGGGVPSTFVRRKLLSMRTLDEMVALIRKVPRSVSVNYCLGSLENKVADIEAVPGQPVRFEPIDRIVTHANHLLVNRDLDVSTGDRFRGERLHALLSERNGAITVEYLMHCLKDHVGAPEGICSHTTENGKPWQTNASLIYDLDARRAWICYGPPCEGVYREYAL
ncbi:MAG TPA: C45 family peptidase [Clostridia bacterium]|nr:C45 family peptidase [Clostridia bacterium]